MAAALEPVEIKPDNASQPMDADYLGSLGLNRLGLEPEESIPVSPPPALPDPVSPPPAAPVQEKPADIIREAAPGRPEAAKRMAEKDARKRVEELEAELNELRPFKTRVTELETSATEYRTLAEQKEAERKALAEAYRNEAAVVPNEVIYELPEVREAYERFTAVGKNLFPRDLSDPTADEPVRSFSASDLTDAKRQEIMDRINLWEKYQNTPGLDPDHRANSQHVLVSQIAQITGVKPERFTSRTVNGVDYPVLPPSHPVYQHLARSIEPFLEARANYLSTENGAREKATESLSKAVQQRVGAARQRWNENGVGLSGDALSTALAKSPDNPTLQAMKLIAAHPDLLQELQEVAELEALATGHSRTQLDLVEVDPNERTAKARALMERVQRRDINAPLVEPLKKLAIRQAGLLAEMQKRLDAAEAEASRTRLQAEPGGVGQSSDGSAVPQTDEYSHLYNKLGLE